MAKGSRGATFDKGVATRRLQGYTIRSPT